MEESYRRFFYSCLVIILVVALFLSLLFIIGAGIILSVVRFGGI